ncbi:lysophospholipid acyltransferase family protein [Nonomuraea spiralis]|uniref:Lysophospholipid acyltransferase family protein n=1 Tax=Nonomuraea spiralis TaxID=46182 RepID=A0ABV5I4X9_9ACTN|nr:lysophospholipid acyltransferase family protein [Nonomuraea spiralis]GGS62341.1 1-acyl-sn-glycerol-3-phosphate acyltransferase [Nonomuraea spiralis]
MSIPAQDHRHEDTASPTTPCAPESCVGPPVTAAGPVRRAARLLGCGLALLTALAVTPVLRHGPAALRGPLSRRSMRLIVGSVGITVRTTNGVPAPAGPGSPGTLLVSNHVSWADSLVLAAVTPARHLAKRDVGRWPLIRSLAAAHRTLFIDRDRPAALPAAVTAVAAALRDGDTVLAYPEGTTWCGHAMGAFHPALFQAALDAGAAVRPVALRYLEGRARSSRGSWVGEESLLTSLLRVVATRHVVAEVTFLPPVRHEPSGRPREDRAALAALAESQVRAAVLGPA